MKTKRIASMIGGLHTFLMAALILLLTTACEKDSPIPHEFSMSEVSSSDHIMEEIFWMTPKGGQLDLFNGAVTIIYKEGAVTNSSEFRMVSFPVHHLDLDGVNQYIRGLYLEGRDSGQLFPNGITLKVKYDMVEENWKKNLPAEEEDLKIYWVSPFLGSYERVVPFEACCVDCECKIIKGCTTKCGFYVVGEK